MRIGATSLIIGFLSFPLTSNFWVFMALMSLVPVGTALTFPSTTALTSRWSEKSELGTTMGTAQSFAGMSRSVSPLMSTALFQQLSHGAPFVAGAALAGMAILLSVRLTDSTPTDTEVGRVGPGPGNAPELREETAESS